MKTRLLQLLNDHRFLLLTALIVPTLFLNKPFHLDDGVFLDMGDRLPWTFIGGETSPVTFDGKVLGPLTPYESTHPPLIPYLLKWIGVLHDAESQPFMLYHLIFLIFPLGAMVAGISLTRDLNLDGAPWLFLLLAPAFLVISTTLMTDGPLTAFWMGAVACTVRHDFRPSKGTALGTILCCLGAMLTAFQAAALPFLLLAYAIYRKRLTCMWPPMLAFVSFVAYLLWIYMDTGFFPILAHTTELNISTLVEMGSVVSNQRHKFTAVLIQLGFHLSPALPWLLAGQSQRHKVITGWVSLLVSIVWFEWIAQEAWMGAYTPSHLLVLRLCFAAGTYWVVSLSCHLPKLWRFRGVPHQSNALLRLSLLWFFCVLTYNILLMPYVNARYVLPALPAALLVVMVHRPTYKTSGLLTGLVLALVLGLACGWLDQARARADYEIYQEVRAKVSAPRDVWYCNDHGLDRYMETWGANYLTLDEIKVPKGAYLVWTGKPFHPSLAGRLREVARFNYPSPLGFTLYGPGSGGGFYASHEGLLPIGRAPLMQQAVLFEVFR